MSDNEIYRWTAELLLGSKTKAQQPKVKQMSILNEVHALIVAAKSQNVDLPAVGQVLSREWYNSAVFPTPGPVFDRNGMSAPDADGCVQFQGVTLTTDKAYTRFACVPGRDLCAKDSRPWAIAAQSVSTALLYQNMNGMPGGQDVYPVTKGTDPHGLPWIPDYTHPLPDAYAIPEDNQTVEQVKAYIQKIQDRWNGKDV